eukprot:COSAG01_NODE_55_length_31115_cov_105.202533_4_plen_175_part_00
MFAANVLITSPLHQSDAISKLGTAHRLCLPARIGISQTIHQFSHSDVVNSAKFCRDGEKIVSASEDRTVKVWNLSTGECQLSLKGHKKSVTSAEFSFDGQKIVSTSQDKTVRVWSAATGECNKQKDIIRHEKSVNSAQISKKGNKIVSASELQSFACKPFFPLVNRPCIRMYTL